MRAIDERLVSRVGVHGLHQTLIDSEIVVENFHQRNEAVGRATRVRNDFVRLGIEIPMVDPVDEGRVCVVARGRDDDQWCATLEVLSGSISLREDAGAFDHDVDAQIAPRESFRVTLAENSNLLAVDADATLGRLDRQRQLTHHRVVFEKVSHRFERPEVVHRDDLDIGLQLAGSAKEVAPDTAESVDTHAYGHGWSFRMVTSPGIVLPRN